MMHNDNYWNMGMTWIIWLPILVFCFIFLFRFFNKVESNKFPEKETPLDILKRRYANGELSTAEYEEKKKIIKGN